MDNETIEVVRKPIIFPRVELDDILRDIVENEDPASGVISDDLKIINIRGTNGSGKSTIPMKMLEKDRAAFILTDNGEEVATVIPRYHTVTIGTYRRKTGGLDGIRSTDRMKEILGKVKYLNLNILMEGILASTVFSTYRDIFYEFRDEHFISRQPVVFTIVPPFDTVKERVLSRNGGKEVKWDQVESKYNTVKRNAEKFKDAGLLSLVVDNSTIEKDETLEWFFSTLNSMGVDWDEVTE